MRRPSSEPWGFGGASRPLVECRRGPHMEGGGAMPLGCCAGGAIRFPTTTPMGAPISARIPAPMPKTTATITIKNPRRPPRKGTAARNGARATTTMIPPTVKPRKAPRNPNPSDFPISFRRNPVRNPMTSPPMRIQYAPSPAEESQQTKYDSQRKADQPDDPNLHPCHLVLPGGFPGRGRPGGAGVYEACKSIIRFRMELKSETDGPTSPSTRSRPVAVARGPSPDNTAGDA